MIWTDSPSWITCWNDGNNYIRAMRHPDIEFIFSQHPWLENDCLFADVILPVNTKLEEDDIGTDLFSGQMNLIFPEPRCIEPLGESFSDYEIVCKIAERLGLLEEYTDGNDHPGAHQDWDTRSRAPPTSISWEEFNEKGYYVIPADPDWEKIPAGLIKFYEDPEKQPAHPPPPASWSSTPPAWPSTSPTTRSDPGAQVDPQGREPRGDHWTASARRSIRCSS